MSTTTIRIECPCGREHTLDVPSVATDESRSWRPVADVAARVGLPAGTVRRWAREGALQGRQGPRKALLVREADVAVLLESRRYEPPQHVTDEGDQVIDLLAVAAQRSRRSA